MYTNLLRILRCCECRLWLRSTGTADGWGCRWMDRGTRAEMAAELDLAAVEVYTLQQDRPIRLTHADVSPSLQPHLCHALMHPPPPPPRARSARPAPVGQTVGARATLVCPGRQLSCAIVDTSSGVVAPASCGNFSSRRCSELIRKR